MIRLLSFICCFNNCSFLKSNESYFLTLKSSKKILIISNFNNPISPLLRGCIYNFFSKNVFRDFHLVARQGNSQNVIYSLSGDFRFANMIEFYILIVSFIYANGAQVCGQQFDQGIQPVVRFITYHPPPRTVQSATARYTAKSSLR